MIFGMRGLVLALTFAACGSDATMPPGPALKSIAVAPSGYTVEQGVQLQASAIGTYGDGSTADLTTKVAWTSTSTAVATLRGHQVFTAGAGTTNLVATLGDVSGMAPLSVTPRASFALPVMGLYTQIEDRSSPAGYWSGQLLREWNGAISTETNLQLDRMQELGVNLITFELRSNDPTVPDGAFVPPNCPVGAPLGPDWPNPSASDLTNLGLLLDALQARGMKMWLRLVNSHMDEQPPTNNTAWLSAILRAVGDHPALDLVLFEGDVHTLAGRCGGLAEPDLPRGPTQAPAQYIEWAFGLAMSLGVPARKLSAEAVIDDYNTFSQQPNTSGYYTDNHFWWAVTTEKAIFDALGLAPADRTYALSFYEHRKCLNVFTGVPCTEEDPHPWADEQLAAVVAMAGAGPRIVAPEMGSLPPVDPWSRAHAYESLIRLMGKYGVDGGSFWRWASFTGSEDADPQLADPIVRRGATFSYNTVEKVLLDWGGWHLPAIANGSFEDGVNHWSGGTSYDLTTEAGQPEVPWRGTHALRLVAAAGQTAAAASDPVSVQPAIVYTTTADVRATFADGNQTAALTILYFQQSGMPSAVRASDAFPIQQSDTPAGFATFPVQYAPPADAAAVRIQFSATGSAQPLTLDVDMVR